RTAPAALPPAEIAEDRPEEIREVAGLAEMCRVRGAAARARARRTARVALPVASQRVVPLSLLGIGKDLVGLVDLLEAVARVLALGNVGVVLPRELAIRGLDGLVVRATLDAENLVVI